LDLLDLYLLHGKQIKKLQCDLKVAKATTNILNISKLTGKSLNNWKTQNV